MAGAGIPPSRLTKSFVDGLLPDERAYFVFDIDVKGFSIRVGTTGAKTWQVEFRPYPGGRGVKMRRMSLGSTKELTPKDARDRALAILAEVKRGNNPAQERIEKRQEMKISDLVDLYEKEGCYVLRGVRQGEPMKPRTKAYTIARLKNHVVPLLGDRPVSEVNSTDIEKMVRGITAGRTAKDERAGNRRRVIVRGGPGAARKVARDLSAVFTFAIRRKFVSANPCEHAAIRKTDNQRIRYLTVDEIGRLGAALEKLEVEGINSKALNIARLWALTGCRRDEIAGLKWTEIDFDHSCLNLEDSKTGRSLRPLAAPALALMASIPKENDSLYVFPATTGDGHFQGTKKIWPKVIEIANLPGVTPHTLRHTLGSAAVSVGETLAMTGAILGHSNMRSTAIYAHVQRDPAAKATDRAVGPIAAALSGKKSGEVVPLKQKR
ncbi:MAG: tyrosine-type recombinase/integrase [Gammaproteobacteria bacterium]|nr:tyrosine-type recombinase/integrase [Gammaproteobacteria bacterium]